MKIINVKRRGKILATNKQLAEIELPNRFYKRADVIIFGEPVKMADGEYYIIGDCEDEEIKYYIPVEWVLIT